MLNASRTNIDRKEAGFDKARPELSALRALIDKKSVFRDVAGEGIQPSLLAPSGQPQRWTIDLRRTFFDAAALGIIAGLFWEKFEAHLPFQIGGLEMGAIPLITAIQLEGKRRGIALNGFAVRKERKTYGLTKLFEGEITDAPIVIVDDIINWAESLEKVRVVLAEMGRIIEAVFAVIDYESARGKLWRTHHQIPVFSLFTLDDFDLRLNAPPEPHNFASYQVVWRFSTKSANFFDVVPKATPVADAHRLFTASDSGDIWALDLKTGQVCWRHPVPGGQRKKIFSSPALYNGRLYCGAYNGNVYALEAATGREVWRFEGADWVGSSPALAPDLNLLFIGLEHALPEKRGAFAALDLMSGKLVFDYPVTSYVHGSPSYCAERKCVAIGTNDNDLLMFDAEKSVLRWAFAAAGPVKYAPAFDLARNAVLFGAHDGCIYMLDIDSGALLWKTETGNAVYSMPLVLDGRAFVSSTDKYIYVLDLEERKVIRKIFTGGKNFASPRLLEGRVYCAATSGAIFEIDPDTLAVTGRLQLPERITNALVYSETSGLFYAMTYDTSVWAFRRSP